MSWQALESWRSKATLFTFGPLKAETLMVAPLIEPFLASDGDVRSTSIIGASRPDQSRVVSPGMNEDISSRNDIWSTVRSDVGKADKLDTSVQQSLSDKWNAAPSRIVEGTAFHLLDENCWTEASSLSTSSTSLHTVLQTSSLLEISSFFPGETILLWLGLLDPIILVERTSPSLARKGSLKGATMSVSAFSGSNEKGSLSSVNSPEFVRTWVMTSLRIMFPPPWTMLWVWLPPLIVRYPPFQMIPNPVTTGSMSVDKEDLGLLAG